MSISQIVPLRIYNQTAYTLVAETNFSNHYSFYTEKSTKPILARRLFVTLGGQHQLANLRGLGFRTFGDVIDESYDVELNDFERMLKVIKEIKKISQLNDTEVKEFIRNVSPIVKYNQVVMLDKVRRSSIHLSTYKPFVHRTL